MSSPQVIGDPYYSITPNHFEPNPIEQQPHNAHFFTINLNANAKFILAPPFAMEDEKFLFDDDDTKNPTAFIENVARISYDTLMKSNDTQVVIQDMLVAVFLPSLSFLADEIVNCGRTMMNNKSYYSSNEEVSVDVSVRVFVDELPQLDSDYDDDDNDDDDYDMNDVPIRFVAASEKSIEKLEKVQVKDNPIFCSICLEDVSVGLEAAKLPCIHAYHEECVVEWLQVSKFCPNCRIEIV